MNGLHEVAGVLVRHDTTARIESVAGRVAKEIRDRAHVDVGETEEPPGEVSRIVVGAKDRAKLLVEDTLDLIAKPIALLDPLDQLGLGLGTVYVLVVLDQGCQHLQPVRVLFEFWPVQRLNLVLEYNISVTSFLIPIFISNLYYTDLFIPIFIYNVCESF